MTTLDDKIIPYITDICKRDPRTGKVVTGGIVSCQDSSWLLSWTINRQGQFKDQDKDKVCVWVYGLFTDVPGDYVKKPMKECTGKEITEEWQMCIRDRACNAKYIHSNLAVYDLQAYASDYADHIVLKEYTINQQKDDIMRDIYLEHPDVVCVSCYIWNLSFVKELMADLIKILPGADFWAGGPEVSYDAEKFLTENSEFKGVMVGEGEETFKELAGYYVEKNPQNLKDMTGICYRDGDQTVSYTHLMPFSRRSSHIFFIIHWNVSTGRRLPKEIKRFPQW